MNNKSIMQIALGDQWEQLPSALQAHYQYSSNSDVGSLDIDYPIYMQPFLTCLHLFGALINRRGTNIPTTVEKHMEGAVQYWNRTIRFPGNKVIIFKSFWVAASYNELIEFVNPYIGLRMNVYVKNGKLYYEGRHFVVKFGPLSLPIPEWLVLGHTTIVETALSDNKFNMDFRIRNPLFGTVFGYSGEFENIS